MGTQFRISRTDGRSDAQVVIDLVQNGKPGTLYKYDELIKALDANTDKQHKITEVRQAVLKANPRLLKQEQRTLRNVRRMGYKLAAATEHLPLSLDRRRRADMQMHRGLELLRHVRLEELDENTRNLHVGQLMIMETVVMQVHSLVQRQNNVENAIKKLNQRLNIKEA